MEINGSKLQVVDSSFKPLQTVRIKKAAELIDPGLPAPLDASMGMTGVVEMEGKIWVYPQGNEASLVQAYFVRIEGIGPVLAGEDWLENWEING